MIDIAADVAVIEVGGLGLAVQCTPATLAGLRRGEEATVHTSLVVREDSLTLYGFTDADERAVFEVLQTVSGVGPRLAQAMLAALRPDALRQIVATEDIAALTQVPGIGKKGAQRLVLELKDKLGAPSIGAAGRAATATSAGRHRRWLAAAGARCPGRARLERPGRRCRAERRRRGVRRGRRLDRGRRPAAAALQSMGRAVAAR